MIPSMIQVGKATALILPTWYLGWRVNLDCPLDWVERCLRDLKTMPLGVSVRALPEMTDLW
jgi:hypothetical protein